MCIRVRVHWTREIFSIIFLKPLGIVENALVTFPEYVLPKMLQKFLKYLFPLWRLETDT